jgi:hypothetical protein
MKDCRSLLILSVSLILVLGAIGGASPAWAWGDLGHKIVCQIPFQELNDKARAEVIRLIALDTTFDSFTDACTWPERTGYWGVHPVELDAAPAQILPRICAQTGSRAGAWDVFCWRGRDVLFAESKQRGRYHIRRSQLSFLEAALTGGLRLESFLIVEWVLES